MIELDLSPDDATRMWCQFARARKITLDGIASGDAMSIGFGIGWTDCLLDQLSRTVDPELAPTGSETQKP